MFPGIYEKPNLGYIDKVCKILEPLNLFIMLLCNKYLGISA